MRFTLSNGVRITVSHKDYGSGHYLMLSSADGSADFSTILTDDERDKLVKALTPPSEDTL